MKKTSNLNKKTASVKSPFKIKSTWDFSPLYKSINDPKIDTDTAMIEKLFADFAKKYAKESSYLEDDSKLLAALKDFEKLHENSDGIKPQFYLEHYKDIDTGNTKALAKLTQITERLTKASNLILFFEINLSKITKEKQQELLKNPAFKDYSYFLEKIFIRSKYNLSEPEEKILSLKSETSHRMWVQAQQKLATSKTVKYKGKDLSIQEALIMRKKLPLKERYALHDLVMNKFKEISFMAEAELNAIVTDKKVEDELRGAKTPYEITVITYENDVKTVENLIETITKNYKIAHDFYKVKASVMGLKKIRIPDLVIDISKTNKKISFEEAVSTVHEAFAKADPFFSDFLKELVEGGNIDIYPRKGKRGGAYCTSSPKSTPIYILLNFDETADGVMVLAHEMGHAIHTKLAFSQPELYVNYPISIAEVASTFFEHIVFAHTYEKLSEEEKVIALLTQIEDSIGLMFRQTQFFNFEKDLHKAIKEKGSISKEEMAALYVKNAKATNGPAVEVVDTDGYAFTNVPHFRYFFYVYSYAYGQIISKALYAKYKEDPSFIEKVKQFLSYGGSKSPYEIFKSIGIDTSKPEFFEEGIKQIREELNVATKLAKKIGLIGKK